MPFSRGNFVDLQIDWFDESDGYVTTAEITADIASLPLFTDTGSGEVNEAQLIIRGGGGDYITSTTPKQIDKFDRIRIQCTDLAGNTYDRYFEVQDLIPSQSKTEGTLLKVECLGIEYHTQRINFAFPFWFRNAFDVAKAIGDQYNKQIEDASNLQPTLSLHDTVYNTTTRVGNDLPKFTNNHYEYGLTHDTCYNRWMDVIDKLGGSVANGGVLDFFELGFKATGTNTIQLRIFSSGGTPSTPVIVKPKVTLGDFVNISDDEGTISNPTGTVVNSWGGDNGSLPTGHAKYESGVFQFVFRPEHVAGLSYKQNARVELDGKHYTSDIDDNTDTPPTNWTQIDMGDEFGDAISYSEWTDEKRELWAMAGSDPTSATIATDIITSTGAGCFDANIVIDNDNFFRTWVDARASSTAALAALTNSGATDFSYDGSAASLPLGFRVLVDGTGTGVFSGNDRHGNARDNSVQEIQFNPATGARGFVGIYFFDDVGTDNDRGQIAVIGEGKVYEFTQAGGWADISANDLGNDCFHQWDTMQNVEGIDPRPNETDSTEFPDITKAGGKFTKSQKSAIQVVYDYDVAFVSRVTSQTQYLSHGVWFNFRFPYPIRIAESPYTYTEEVGDIYGGGTNTTDSPYNPSTLDVSNLGYTPTGLLGFNQTDSDALGELKSFSFALSLTLEQKLPVAGTLVQADNPTNWSVFLFDTKDNVVRADFNLKNSDGTWEVKDIPLSSFEIYRAHKPRYITLNGLADLISPRKLEIYNLFEWRNVKLMVIQLQDSYDEFDRFSPEGQTFDVSNVLLPKALGGKATANIDDVHFKKPLFVSSSQNLVRNLEVFEHRPNIILYDQLLQDAKSRLEIEKFQHKGFNIGTSGDSMFDIPFGDTFTLENSELVSDSDAGSNTINLVAKRVEYSITNPVAGEGGLTRRLAGVKRFT